MGVTFAVCPEFRRVAVRWTAADYSFVSKELRVLFFVVLAIVLVGAGEFLEQVGVLDGGRDFIVAAGPFAEVDAAAAVGAEGEVFATGEDDVAAGGAAKGFNLSHGGIYFKSVWVVMLLVAIVRQI
jgi:hypothetical protein